MISLEKYEKKGLMWRISLEAASLVQKFPPQFMNGHKKWIYSQVSYENTPPTGNVRISRWQSLPIPSPGDFLQSITRETRVKTDPGFFKYENQSNGSNNEEIVWYLNFADRNLFGFYQGPLFAQDEIQVLEHPILGSIRAWLEDQSLNDPMYHPNTQDANGSPTPYLIMGAERKVVVSTNPDDRLNRPNGLYGKNFMNATLDAVKEATRILKTPTISNILAISAISNQHGEYTKFQINKLFSTLYTGFIGVRIASQKSQNNNQKAPKKITIHTGNWGCGAFGGNPILIALLQFIAAFSAGIDTLIYHPVSFSHQFSEALKIFETNYKDKIQKKGLIFALNEIKTFGFKWGVSDGN